MSASLDFAAPKLGSGARFKKLSATLAKRGASNPDALAAFIGRRKFGNAGMGKLSAGKSLANDADLAIYLAAGAQDDSQGQALKCPQCGYSGPASRSSAPGDDAQAGPAGPAKTPAAAAMANGTREALELATGTVRHPVREAVDVRPYRQPDGSSVLRHRNGGAEIARIRQTPEGKWVATVGGKDLPPRNIQRTALMEAVGTYNGAITSAAKRQQDAPLQPPPQQTELMAEYGIPAMRSAAFATPTAGASDGPRMTTSAASSDADDSAGTSGLSPKAQAIYKKLIAKGFPAARALAFARNSEKFTAGKAAA